MKRMFLSAQGMVNMTIYDLKNDNFGKLLLADDNVLYIPLKRNYGIYDAVHLFSIFLVHNSMVSERTHLLN